MLTEIIIGIISGLSFPLGAFIYKLTKIEIDPLMKSADIKSLRKILLAAAFALGLITIHADYAIIYFAIGLILTVFICSKSNNPIKYSLACSGIFLLAFIIGFIAKNLA